MQLKLLYTKFSVSVFLNQPSPAFKYLARRAQVFYTQVFYQSRCHNLGLHMSWLALAISSYIRMLSSAFSGYMLITKPFQVLQTSKWSVFHNFIVHWKGTQVIINPELLPANLMSSIPYSVSEVTQIESYLHGLQHELKHFCRHLREDFNILI